MDPADLGVKLEALDGVDEGPPVHGNLDSYSSIRQDQICGICGCDIKNRACRARHEKSHANVHKWKCSVCGLTHDSVSKQLQHEQKAHDLKRHPLDANNPNAIKIRKSQLTTIFNVGFKLVEVQSTAVSSSALMMDGEEEATVADLEELQRTKPHRPPSFPPCPHCGMKSFTTNVNGRTLHIESHSATDGFQCSLCGIYKKTASERNLHEKFSHGMVRHKADYHVKEPLRIFYTQRRFFRQIGTNFKQVQRDAVKSESNLSSAFLVEVIRRKRPATKRKTPAQSPPASSRARASHNQTSPAKRPRGRPPKRQTIAGIPGGEAGTSGLSGGSPRRSLPARNGAHVCRAPSPLEPPAPSLSPNEILRSLFASAGVEQLAVHPAVQFVEPPAEQPVQLVAELSVEHVVEEPREEPRPPPVNQPVEQEVEPEVITLSDSEDEQPTRPAAPGVRLLKEESRPAPVQPPLAVVQPVVKPAAQEEGGGSKRNRIMSEMTKRPQLFYFDYTAFGRDPGVFPLTMWTNASACSLLVVRLDTPEWKGKFALPPHTFLFQLDDCGGHFLLFNKEADRPLADRLVASGLLGAGHKTFRQLMDAIAALDLRSALIVADEETRIFAQHLQSAKFCVV